MNAPTRYSFGPFVLDTGRRELARNGAPVHLTPKELDLLILLAENAGHVVEKAEILDRVWHGTFVEEGNITQTVSVLRKAVENAPGMAGCIRTAAKHGYRFEHRVDLEEKISPRRRRPRLTPALVLPVLTVVVAGYLALDLARISPSPPHLHSVLLLPVEGRTPDASAGDTCELLLRSIQRSAVQVKPMTVVLAARDAGGLPANPGQIAKAKRAGAALSGDVESRGRFLRVRIGLWRAEQGYAEWSSEFEFLPQDASAAAAYIGEQIRARLEALKSK